MRLAIVVPRYGPGIVGGAETLCRDYAERLRGAGHDVEVLTTCARDHFTWRNDLPAGTTVIDGITVHRYPVTIAKDHGAVTMLHARLDAGFALDARGERRWVENTGYSEPMLQAIGEVAGRVDAVLFAPYLFASTVFGARVAPEKSLVIPCLHDESYARFELVRETLQGVAGLIFNSEPECDLAQRLLGEAMPRHRVVGVGFDEPAARVDAAAWRQRNGIEGDMVAYAGRREIAKNFPLLLQWMTAYNQGLSRHGPALLAAMGSGEIRAPRSARGILRDIGFASPHEMLEAFGASVATAQLSLNESFSYVLMESWLAGTPAIVHAGCAVTRFHCEESGGGLWVRDAESFAAALDRLRGDTALRAQLSASGGKYVRSRYSWPAVVRRLEDAVRELAA
ncbi:MAG TPA: glycosyltransferase family 4 protein [Candidatus Dormibacteraeota bacterium]|jgi:glycosyltransferase involved in cell wall biosynthesis|nr:glycosyltransferase family 4 protein [Candidatus Dormibacteraeota bacterium]